MTPLHLAAREYAAKGISVLACRAGNKEPATAHGVKDATRDIATIDRLWSAEDHNIGIALEACGWCALDFDGSEGEDAWFTLQIENGFAPDTYEVKTPRGRHLYFKGSLPPTKSKLGPKIDTRGRGSYVLAPPSVVNGKMYEACNSLEPADLPEWIAQLLAKPERSEHEFSAPSGKPVNPGIIENMLRCIDPSCGRNDWLIVCGGLVSAPVADPAWDGFDLFVRWSRGDLHGGAVPANYKGPEDCEAQWQRDVEKLHGR